MSSTLVETVSIDFEDFTESFLTCGTCLCSFDGGDHNPKLLRCSHTVCVHCLGRIVASHARDDGTFRCPICRESIPIPSGGVAALPPSFLVNQLLDLMSRQRREVIPKCSVHSNQELLFCESCDLVFCIHCSSGSHQANSASYQHTVIPLSIAVKRMSEILCYKANECYSKLNEASDAVTTEMHQLDHTADATFEDVNRSFQAIIDVIEQRRDEVIGTVKKLRDDKKKVLKDHIDIIEAERKKVQQECEGLQYQVEVRNITKKIAHLNTKIDSLSTLSEPRENSFLKFDKGRDAFEQVRDIVNGYGRVYTSRTFPSLCFMKSRKATTHLRSEVIVYTVDYDGETQMVGGDPIVAEVKDESGTVLECQVGDHEDGTYSVFFTPHQPGNHSVSVSIFGRPVRENPLVVEVIDEHNPDIVYGCRGGGKDQFLQPVGICVDENEFLYVADTGNSRIKVLTPQLKESQHIVGEALEGRSVTGITKTPNNSLMFVNWRQRTVTEVTPSGELLSQFTHEQLVEPTTLSVNNDGEILVVDNGMSSVFVFLPGGKLVRMWGEKGDRAGQLGIVTAVCAGPDNEVIVADSRIQVFSPEGKFLRTIYEAPKGKGPKGTYGGLFLDPKGFLLATRQERNNSCIQVFDFALGTLIFTIDSREARLKRPSGLATTHDGYVVIVDLGNDCVKKFRYM